MTDGQRYKAAMRKAGVSQKDLAALAGVDRQTVWRWCRDKTPVPAYAWIVLKHAKKSTS